MRGGRAGWTRALKPFFSPGRAAQTLVGIAFSLLVPWAVGKFTNVTFPDQVILGAGFLLLWIAGFITWDDHGRSRVQQWWAARQPPPPSPPPQWIAEATVKDGKVELVLASRSGGTSPSLPECEVEDPLRGPVEMARLRPGDYYDGNINGLKVAYPDDFDNAPDRLSAGGPYKAVWGNRVVRQVVKDGEWGLEAGENRKLAECFFHIPKRREG